VPLFVVQWVSYTREGFFLSIGLFLSANVLP